MTSYGSPTMDGLCSLVQPIIWNFPIKEPQKQEATKSGIVQILELVHSLGIRRISLETNHQDSPTDLSIGPDCICP